MCERVQLSAAVRYSGSAGLLTPSAPRFKTWVKIMVVLTSA